MSLKAIGKIAPISKSGNQISTHAHTNISVIQLKCVSRAVFLLRVHAKERKKDEKN